MQTAKPLIDTLGKILREMQTKTHCLSLQELNTEAISVPLGEVKATKVLIT